MGSPFLKGGGGGREFEHPPQCPNLALGATVTVTVTVNRGTIKDQKALRDASACKGLQDTA